MTNEVALGSMLRQSSGDDVASSLRSSTVREARRASIASTWALLGADSPVLTAIAEVTPRARAMTAAEAGVAGSSVSARTSAPAMNADWSNADCRQL